LYELLAGRPPFKAATPLDTLARVLHEEPVPPGRLRPGLPRDLETICLKCLQKEPGQRYAGADALADDLSRFLAGEPVQARPVGTAERLWRWCRRNRAVAALAVGLSAVLLAGAAVSTWQAVRATLAEREAITERDRAEKHFSMARDAVDRYFTKVSESPSLRAFALENLRRDLLLQAKDFYEQLIRDQPEESGLRADLAKSYGRLGNICSTLGETSAAEANYGKAIALFEELSRAEPDNPEYQRSLAQAQRDLGRMFHETSRPEKARLLLDQAVATADTLVRRHGGAAEYRHDLALGYHALGRVWRHTQRPGNAEDALRQAIAIEEELLRAHTDGSGKYRSTLASCAGELAEVYRLAGRSEESEACSLRAMHVYEQLAGEFRGEADYHYNLATQYHGLGSLYQDTKRKEKAEAPLKKAAAIGEELLRAHPDVVDFVVLQAECCSRLARFENGRGRTQAVLSWCDKGIQTLQRVTVREPRHSKARWTLNDLRIGRAVSLARLGDYAASAKGADEMAREEGLTPVSVFNVACVYARCSEAAGKDTNLSPAGRVQLQERYAGRAMDSLRLAVARGFKTVPAIESEPDLDTLRQREDFQKLLRALEETTSAPQEK
jgi:tetratricopeptide (TPR) repeat protein